MNPILIQLTTKGGEKIALIVTNIISFMPSTAVAGCNTYVQSLNDDGCHVKETYEDILMQFGYGSSTINTRRYDD